MGGNPQITPIPIDYIRYEPGVKTTVAYTNKGTVSAYEDLPSTSNLVEGDMYQVGDTDDYYVWGGRYWNLVTLPESGGNVEHITWHQCPEAVRNFLEYVDEHPYDPNDMSYTYVLDFATSADRETNSLPVGYTIDGVTYYDNEPFVSEPFATDSSAGTLTALDHLRWYNTTHGTPSGNAYQRGWNCRDLGGWPCDGGTVKYGVIIRSGEINPVDKGLMVDKIGVRTEINLLPTSEQASDTSPWGIDYVANPTDAHMMYSIAASVKGQWELYLKTLIRSVNQSKPVLFHCGAGADKTGTFAIMVLGLLGCSLQDITIDFELTTFAAYSDWRNRTLDGFIDLINAIKAVPLATGLADTFANHCISFALSVGISVSEINAFRANCINGTPSVISPTIQTYTVTKSATSASFDNDVASVDENLAYEVGITPSDGYVISDISITMGGNNNYNFSGTEVNLWRKITYNLSNCVSSNRVISVIDGQGFVADITANDGYTLDGATVSITMGGTEMSAYYSEGKIAIPHVTGDIVISVTAVRQAPHYTNLADPSSSEWKSGYRINSSAQIASQVNSTVTNTFPVAVGDTIRIKGVGNMTDYISASFASASETSGSRMTVNRTYDDTTDINTVVITATDYALGRFAFLTSKITTSADDIIITRNEEIPAS